MIEAPQWPEIRKLQDKLAEVTGHKDELIRRESELRQQLGSLYHGVAEWHLSQVGGDTHGTTPP